MHIQKFLYYDSSFFLLVYPFLLKILLRVTPDTKDLLVDTSIFINQFTYNCSSMSAVSAQQRTYLHEGLGCPLILYARHQGSSFSDHHKPWLLVPLNSCMARSALQKGQDHSPAKAFLEKSSTWIWNTWTFLLVSFAMYVYR